MATRIEPFEKTHWFWLWGLPVACVLFILAASQMGHDLVNAVIVSPFGLCENLPTIFLMVGVWYAIAIARLPEADKLRGWMIVYALALVYFAGEDQNWFQYWLGAEVPDFFLEHNREKEINLHNINGWFNQKPRILVEVWSVVACILVPLGIWAWPRRATQKFIPANLWPDTRVVPIAVISFVIGMSGRIFKHFFPEIGFNANPGEVGIMSELFPGVRISELQEITFAYLMLLFPLLLYRRLRAM